MSMRILLVLAAILLCVSCNEQQENSSDLGAKRWNSTSDIKAELLKQDFSEAVASCSTFDSNIVLDSKVSGRDESVRRAVMAKLLPSGKPWMIADTLIAVHKYCLAHGELPGDATDLFPELLTSNGAEAFLAMPVSERLERYHLAVNPLTGRFYQSFVDSWNPGGIAFGRPPALEYQSETGRGTTTLRLGEEGFDVFVYKVFGPEQGEELLRDLLEVRKPQADEHVDAGMQLDLSALPVIQYVEDMAPVQ